MNNDTISLLQECSAGANMAMSAIDQVLEGVENPALHDGHRIRCLLQPAVKVLYRKA